MESTINILIRTNKRPQYFKRCIDSIRNQTYKNVQIFVSASNEDTADYVSSTGINPVLVPELKRTVQQTFPWNSYLNILKAKVTDGWILILDDDDFLQSTDVLERLVHYLQDTSSLYVFKMQYADGRTLPDAGFFGTTPFVRKHIAMPCFSFHSKYKNLVHFDSQRAGDLRFINKLLGYVNTVYWLDEVVVGLSNFGLNGANKDLNDETIKP